MEKKQFFETIGNLPVRDKVAQVIRNFSGEEAEDISANIIARDKTISFDEKKELIQEFFPERRDKLITLLIGSYQKKSKNLSNRLKLKDYFSQKLPEIQQAGSKKAVNIKTLNTLTSFLTQKRDLNEFVDKEDCLIISNFFKTEWYEEYRDQMNGLIIMAFRFRKQLIKEQASAFVAELLEQGYLDTVLLLELVRGGYISVEVSSLLTRFAKTICQKEYLKQEILREIDKLLKLKDATKDEKLMLQEVKNLYQSL